MEAVLKPTVFIIDDDPTFKSTLSRQLENLGFITKTFSFLETFFTFYRQDIPGCLIIDIRTTGNIGTNLINSLRHRNIYLTVIFLSEKPEVSTAVQAIKLGAVDFLSKTADTTTLVNSINQALRSNYVRRAFEKGQHRANTLYTQLSTREKEVFHYILRGFTNKEMAEKLAITLKTIEAHRANIMNKMQVNSLPELVTLAVKFNLIKEDDPCLIP